jgi:DNA polymerase III, beta subunit
MEFTVRREDLLKELQRLQGVVEKKNTIPILSNTFLSAHQDELELVATDLELGIRTSTRAKVSDPGAITLSSKKIFEIVRLLPEDDVKFRVEDNHWVQLTCARSRFRIVGMPKDEFPALPAYDFARAVPFDLKTLKAMVSKVLFATTSDDTRYPLQGILVLLGPEGLTLVATDGHRLACIKGKAARKPTEKEIRVIVPRKTLAEISRIDWEGAEEILFGVHENRAFWKTERVTLVSNTVEGVFPAYEKVIPKENDKILELNVQHFTDAVRRVSLLSNERSRAVKIALQPGKIEISSSNPEMGEARENVEVGYRGAEMEIGFNARYLLDFLGAVGEEKISLHLKDEQTQGMMTPLTASEWDYRYVVMPMRI